MELLEVLGAGDCNWLFELGLFSATGLSDLELANENRYINFPTYFNNCLLYLGLKRQRPIYGVSPLSSFQGYFRRPYRNDRLQVIRLKRKDLLQQNNGGSLKVIRL